MSVPLDDRAMHYGDGLFETVRVERRAAPLWDWHLQRLTAGCTRLRLPRPPAEQLWEAIASAVSNEAATVVKLIISAGSGPRGYARPQSVSPKVYVQSAPVSDSRMNLRAVWCQTLCSIQPQLAGIKHLNRLEQVLARMECTDVGADEGLMLDTSGAVISATAGNLLIRRSGRWLTPPLDRCGVAGVARRWLMQSFGIVESTMSIADVDAADCLVVSNAIHGPRQVLELGGRQYLPDLEVSAWQGCWSALFNGVPR